MKLNLKLISIATLLVVIVLGLGLSMTGLTEKFGLTVNAQNRDSSTAKKRKSVIENTDGVTSSTAVAFGVSRPARELPNSVPDAKSRAAKWVNPEELRERTIEQRREELEDGGVKDEDKINERNEERVRQIVPGAGAGDGKFTDPLLPTKTDRNKSSLAPLAPLAMPTPSLTFLGNGTVDNNAQGFGNFTPPDTNGDVGPNHYVQAINVVFSIYNKSTGARITGPTKISSLWTSAGLGGICSTNDNGDPIVLYDPLADRWLISQFAFNGDGTTPPYYQCIAVSKTGDPTGAYNLYTFQMPNNKFNDYPHFGVWSDGYYMTDNQFTNGATFSNSGAFAFDRNKMLIGDPTASYIYFDLANIDTNSGGVLPLDLDGKVAPPSGMPMLISYFLADEFNDPMDGLRIFEFKADFANPGASSLVQRQDVPLAAFDARQPNTRRLIEQLGGATANHLDAIADRLMFRLAYRNLGTFQSPINSITGNFTVNVSGVNPTNAATYQAGIRWFELRTTSAVPTNTTVFDQGTHNLTPGNGATGLNNWMGSVAQDRTGAIALGFSQSGTTKFADIVIAGRSTNTAAGTLNEGEALFFAAGGRQTSTGNRWGDYSMMAVDPTDECTFWYTQEYYAATSATVFSTRIGKFKFPGCTAAVGGTGTVTGTVTNCATGAPINNALVTLFPISLSGTTNATGNYGITAPPGTYTAQATANGYTSGAGSSTNVTVTDGGNTVANLCLIGIPAVGSGGATITAESYTPANGAIDPGETVTVILNVTNTGTAPTTNAVGTLQATGGVMNPTPASQNYGVIQPGQTVGRSFTFTASSTISCGSNIIASLQIQDGAMNLGTVTYTFTTGTTATLLSENFDGVTPPVLPAGWTAVNASGPAPLWVTSNSGTPAPASDTAPNAAFVNDPNVVSDKQLITPSFTPAVNAKVTFRNNFNLESGFDGGVLEISINGGTYVDIITAGGSFVAGGYNGTITTTNFGSPIQGRAAWTGNSGGFITTTVNLPASSGGQTVKLRFRMGSDNSTAGTGWRIDTFQVTSPVCNGTPPPTPTNILQDGGFEQNTDAGTNPFWTSTSTLFGTSLCTLAGCGTGGGASPPRTGNGWTWFDGGSAGSAAETGTVQQDVTIPANRQSVLSYYLRRGSVSAPATSVLTVRVDGNVVETVTEPTTPDADYILHTINLPMYTSMPNTSAPDATHTILFSYNRPDVQTGVDSFTIDDVSLVLLAPTAADASITGRVMNRSGRAIANATVTLKDQNGNAVVSRTNAFGYYGFQNIESGQTYILSASHKGNRFSSRVIVIKENLQDINIIALN